MSIIYTLSQDVYHVYAEFEMKKTPHFSFEMFLLSCWVEECSLPVKEK